MFGVYRRDADLDVVATTYYGLYALQHRGQESCGMAVNDDGVFYKRRELGLVNEVFTKDVLETMPRGNMCIGHCRYATTGTPVRANAQPFVIRHIKGPMALAHNGNLTNSAELRAGIRAVGRASSTPPVGHRGHRLRHHPRAPFLRQHRTGRGANAMARLKGAYSLVVDEPAQAHRRAGPAGLPARCASASWATTTSLPARAAPSPPRAASSCAMWSRARSWCLTKTACRSIRTHCGMPHRPVRV